MTGESLHPQVPRSLLPRWTVPVVAVVVLAAAGVAGWVLWQWIDSLALADPEKEAAAQLDVVKVSASVAVAGGGLFALYLAARRQRTQELELEARQAELRHRQAELSQRDRTQNHAEQVAETNRLHSERVAIASEWDAASRRVTELYSTSVGQLGSDHAAVRLGGMYALERLAQDNPPQRQTVVSVLCAYLRMPYTVPADKPADKPAVRRLGRPRAPLRASRDRPAAATGSTLPRQDDQAILQEREVRLTAQRLLFSHLIPQLRGPDHIVHRSPGFWADVDLDLSGASLIDFALAGCAVRTFLAPGAKFIGTTSFAGSAFTGPAQFDKAIFAGPAHFDKATFTVHADFRAATFAGSHSQTYDLDHSKPYGNSFIDVSFGDGARFDAAGFTGFTRFDGVSFAGPARFDGATFADGVSFIGATFDNTRFTSHSFLLAKFAGRTYFAKARFAGSTWFTGATFDELTGFDGALIEQDVLTRYSAMAERSDRLQSRRPVLWPPGWLPADEHITVEGLAGAWHTLERTESAPGANSEDPAN